MEYVRKSDVERMSALTNKGFDPNYIDRSTGGSRLRLDHRLNDKARFPLSELSGRQLD